jgi:anaerobic selenocysteine-containing dehydrogenase
MESVSRRKFFKQAGAVAAAAGAVAVAPLSVAGAVAGLKSTPDAPLTPQEDLRGDEELVAHVKNARTGEIALFIGHREVTLKDRKVAARLVRAAR